MKNIMPPINTPDNAFHDGNPATGEQGTIVPGLWLNNVQGATRNTQQELISVLNEAGIEINESVNNQLLLAIVKLITDKTPALPVASLIIKGIAQLSSSITSTSEALAATPKAVKTVNDAALQKSANLSDLASPQTALTNLGVPSSSLVPIGVPLPYPLATPPTGFLKCNGSSFSAATYPKLALAYPSGVLPDLRGEFLRGWDDGRGVDDGRGLLTVENDEIRSHRHLKLNVDTSGVAYGLAAGNFSGQQTGGFYANTTIGYDSGTPGIGTGATGGSETRPRNIAFNYIVRAI